MLQLDFSINFMDKSSTVSSSPGHDALSPALSRKHFQQPADGRWFPPGYCPPSYKLNIRKYVVKHRSKNKQTSPAPIVIYGPSIHSHS